ncbi:hypothetical protein CN980_28990 [Bacillus cereus]|uniref:YopX protein domain-containing protein n=1 Tax=Bacillus cereus TaxID=1396 RepID=A0A9X7GM40_BACCE|nr:YopX family protein [Bacillus cereus]PGO61768.1 hypothetical protein CN980_28990 [Bacillus cereus]
MREIKFRCFDLQNKKFVEGDILRDYVLGEMLDDVSCEVSQFTGLKDKNGKEIYEGDILDLSLDDVSVLRCEIVYQASSFCRKWHDANTIRLRRREIEHMAWNTYILYEVIGNIYENPKLLNGVGDSE